MEAKFAEVVLEGMDTPLAVGDRAPDADGVPSDGKRVIVFIRGSWCAPCRRQLGELQDRRGEIESHGGTLIVISADETPAFDAVRRRMGLTCRFVSDPHLAIAARYGVRMSDGRFPIPSVFVLDASGVVRFAQVARTVVGLARLDDVIAALDTSAATDRAARSLARSPPSPSPSHAGAAPDANESLRLFPELTASPAPPWVKAGTCITYASTEVALVGADPGVRIDEQGEWVTVAGQRIAAKEHLEVRMLREVRVVALTRDNAVLSVTSWGLPSGTLPARRGESAIVGVPGAGGEYWIDPAVLRKAAHAVPPDARIVRRPYVVLAKRYDAVWIASGSDSEHRLAVYDVESGALLHQASMTPPESTSPADSPRSAPGARALATSTLVTIRDAPPPWANASPPLWLSMMQWTDFVGDETTAVPGHAPTSVARTRHVSVDARGAGWLRLNNEDRQATSGQAPSAPRRSVRVAGPAQYFGFYVPPSALADLRPGRELDRDPMTRFVIVVGSAMRVDGHDAVVIVGENDTCRLEAAYDRSTGMRIHVTVHDKTRDVRREWKLGS